MTSFWNKLNVYYKTALLSLAIGVVLSLVLMFLFFIGQGEIVLGLSLGILFGIIIYLINGIIENKQEDSHKYRLTVAFMFTRLVLLVGFMVGMGFLYYPGNVHAFNIIAIAGGYFIVEIAFIVLHLRKRNDL